MKYSENSNEINGLLMVVQFLTKVIKFVLIQY